MNSLVRLTDIQLVLLATAAQRDNGNLLPPPETLGEGPARIRKAVESLIRRGLAEEVAIRSSAGTNFGLPAVVVDCTNSTIAFFAAPSFQDGSGSCAHTLVELATRTRRFARILRTIVMLPPETAMRPAA